MKSIIITESQAKNLLDNVIIEQTTNTICDSSFLYDVLNRSGNLPFKKEMAKFKVTNIIGSGVKFNGKPIEENTGGYILLPKTSITMCMSDHIFMSGMGLPNCGIQWDKNGLSFITQYA